MPNNDILKLIADNPTLAQAMKDLLLKQFSYDDINADATNQDAGEAFRVVARGRTKIEAAFQELNRHKTPEPRVERVNRAV